MGWAERNIYLIYLLAWFAVALLIALLAKLGVWIWRRNGRHDVLSTRDDGDV